MIFKPQQAMANARLLSPSEATGGKMGKKPLLEEGKRKIEVDNTLAKIYGKRKLVAAFLAAKPTLEQELKAASELLAEFNGLASIAIQTNSIEGSSDRLKEIGANHIEISKRLSNAAATSGPEGRFIIGSIANQFNQLAYHIFCANPELIIANPNLAEKAVTLSSANIEALSRFLSDVKELKLAPDQPVPALEIPKFPSF